MARRLLFGGLWLGFVGYAFLLSPPNQPGTVDLIQHLSLGQLDGINPLVIALFYIMGVWPLIYSSLLLFDGRGQAVRAWPFAIASFGVGAFALLPYLALRQPNPQFMGSKDGLLRWLDSRWNGVAIVLMVIGLLAYGLINGDWADFVAQWQTSRFVHVMSLDFGLLCLLFPTLLMDDMARRQWHSPALFWLVTLLPLLGPSLYLSIRPGLPASSSSQGMTEDTRPHPSKFAP